MTALEAASFLEAYASPGSRLGLERVKALMHALGDPQDDLKYIHIAGTNGKGSTASMIASVLSSAGYKTGLYTSPALNRFNERIRVDGEEIDDASLMAIANLVTLQADKMDDKPTLFELMTAIAFIYFEKIACDFVVLEVGMGGRMDATNLIKEAAVSVITQIDKDHMSVLGDTLSKIAGEKAGIIREKTPVVLLNQDEVVMKLMRETCERFQAPLTVVSKGTICRSQRIDHMQCFDYGHYEALKIPLLGLYQLSNAALAVEVIDVLRRIGYTISDKAVRTGLEKVKWPGRFEYMCQKPLFVVDGAHNVNGIKAMAESLAMLFPAGKATILMGVMADKAYQEMIKCIIPYAERFICVTPENSRALPSRRLKEQIQMYFDGDVLDTDSVADGVALALKMGWDTCAFGSLYMVGAIRAQFRQL
ncbi:MAG: dihydrofolate synthase / folylpolyglutamate synthase [Clostridiales bacterium]|nr:dihydrofolate synthase / folylpolyglutamate synthase [Clostridiales bacterium]MDN5297504.1 dihydrofolate synthase / folylpolyglutamate synthase [Clostridiales bacterium]